VLLLLVAAGEGVANLVDSVLCGAFGLVDAAPVLEVSVFGQRAGCFFRATFALSMFLLVMGAPWLG
jgi:hypothetical protein